MQRSSVSWYLCCPKPKSMLKLNIFVVNGLVNGEWSFWAHALLHVLLVVKASTKIELECVTIFLPKTMVSFSLDQIEKRLSAQFLNVQVKPYLSLLMCKPGLLDQSLLFVYSRRRME